MVYRILIILGLLFHAQSYADAWYEGSHGGSFYSGDLASRQSESTQSFIQAPPQKYKSGSSAPFFADATVPSFEGGQAKVTKQITKYYLFPMQMQKGQHAVFTGKLEGSNKIVTLKDMELVNKMVNQQLPIINGTMHLIVGKKVVMVLTFKGNTMRIKELPDDLLPTQQICES
ncbi:MAG TPA: hypothetical protein QGF02_00810, partial [Candidatus Babeliales bacterium]|nr:hypothetical protein [Candidatus Babeliales bacterium]